MRTGLPFAACSTSLAHVALCRFLFLFSAPSLLCSIASDRSRGFPCSTILCLDQAGSHVASIVQALGARGFGDIATIAESGLGATLARKKTKMVIRCMSIGLENGATIAWIGLMHRKSNGSRIFCECTCTCGWYVGQHVQRAQKTKYTSYCKTIVLQIVLRKCSLTMGGVILCRVCGHCRICVGLDQAQITQNTGVKP